MWEFLLHLWAGPPVDAIVPCTAPIPPALADPGGLFDERQLTGVWSHMAIASVVAVVLIVALTYLASRGSLNRGFVVRWYAALATSSFVCLVIPMVIGLLTKVDTALGTCTTEPVAMPKDLSLDLLWMRMGAGFVWGALAFVLLSLFCTQVLGRTPVAGGFFHNRGCPLPRWNPLQG